MTRRRHLAQLGVVVAALLVAFGASNVAFGADSSISRHGHDAVAAERAGNREVGAHARVLKSPRSERLMRLGFAVRAAAAMTVALRRRSTTRVAPRSWRLGCVAGPLGRGPPALLVS
jgi:hypothetical protein